MSRLNQNRECRDYGLADLFIAFRMIRMEERKINAYKI